MTRELGVARRRTDPQAVRGPLDPAQLRDPVQRDQVLRQRPFPLPCPHDEIGPAGDRSVSGGRGVRASASVVGEVNRTSTSGLLRSDAMASKTRSGVIGSSSTRVPMARAMALRSHLASGRTAARRCP